VLDPVPLGVIPALADALKLPVESPNGVLIQRLGRRPSGAGQILMQLSPKLASRARRTDQEPGPVPERTAVDSTLCEARCRGRGDKSHWAGGYPDIVSPRRVIKNYDPVRFAKVHDALRDAVSVPSDQDASVAVAGHGSHH
jgi:hypothetical protein